MNKDARQLFPVTFMRSDPLAIGLCQRPSIAFASNHFQAYTATDRDQAARIKGVLTLMVQSPGCDFALLAKPALPGLEYLAAGCSGNAFVNVPTRENPIVCPRLPATQSQESRRVALYYQLADRYPYPSDTSPMTVTLSQLAPAI
jgi:hypothetical protein